MALLCAEIRVIVSLSRSGAAGLAAGLDMLMRSCRNLLNMRAFLLHNDEVYVIFPTNITHSAHTLDLTLHLQVCVKATVDTYDDSLIFLIFLVFDLIHSGMENVACNTYISCACIPRKASKVCWDLGLDQQIFTNSLRMEDSPSHIFHHSKPRCRVIFDWCGGRRRVSYSAPSVCLIRQCRNVVQDKHDLLTPPTSGLPYRTQSSSSRYSAS